MAWLGLYPESNGAKSAVPPSVIHPGAGTPVLVSVYSCHDAGVASPGSSGRPAATASRCVQVRGTTCDQLVPAAPGEQPAAARELVRELVQFLVGGPLRVDGQLQVGQRVEPVRIAAVLADQDLRAERAQQRRHDRVERAQPVRVPGARGQRHVDRHPVRLGPAGVAGQPGAGEQGHRVLVQADGQHPRVVVEGGLDAIPVVHVDVHVGDPLRTLLQQPADRDGRVVVDAEAAGRPPHGVVQAAGHVGPVRGLAGPHGRGRGQRGPGHQRRRLVHAGEDRVVRGAQAVRTGRPPRAGPPRCTRGRAPARAAPAWRARGRPRSPRRRRAPPSPGPGPWSAPRGPARAGARARSRSWSAGHPRPRAGCRSCVPQLAAPVPGRLDRGQERGADPVPLQLADGGDRGPAG